MDDLQSPAMQRVALGAYARSSPASSPSSSARAPASHWDDVLLFRHAQYFGIKDPQFHRDLGFYVFKLPVYQFVLDWLLGAFVVTIIGTLARLRLPRRPLRLPHRCAAADRAARLPHRCAARHQAAHLDPARRAAAHLHRPLLPQHVRARLLHAGRGSSARSTPTSTRICRSST